MRPTLAGSYAYVNPAIAVMLGAWLAAEHFSAHDIGAMVVILLGVVAITLAKARAPKAPATAARGIDMTPATLDRRGLWVAAGSFVLWGVMPLYWHLLKSVPSLQIIAHRIVWSTLLVVGWLSWKYGRAWLRETLAQPRAAWMLALSGVLIAFNWGLYIWAVNAGHVVETSLGYFINPLLNVVLGVVVLRERLNRVQWASVAIADRRACCG